MAVVHRLLGETAMLLARTAQETPTASTTSLRTPQPSTDTSGQNNDNGNNNGGNNNSPLLFFVALGFGVVFTNLWIIVGVKYCFRYNARNRARMASDDTEPITLETVQRPHRRRREKKLMTMDEVNDKFPMMKYKSWVAARTDEGLPAAGGLSVAAAPAASIHDADRLTTKTSAKDRSSMDERRLSDVTATIANSPPLDVNSQTDKVQDAEKAQLISQEKEALDQTPAALPTPPQPLQAVAVETDDDDDDDDDDDVDDDDDPIDAAIPPECLGAAGDTCAICIDTLEDDDDVRGLTCGHAFHAVCLDPWLTSRRACCPLCKADYYTPKQRANPDGEANPTNNVTFDPRTNTRLNLPTGLRSAWFRGAANTHSRPASTLLRVPATMLPRRMSRRRGQARLDQRASQPNVALARQPDASEQPQPSDGRMLLTVRQALRLGRRRNDQPAAPPASATSENAAPTPSQLEMGSRPPVSSVQ